jgi:hypothetical protein
VPLHAGAELGGHYKKKNIAASIRPGTDVMTFKIYSPKKVSHLAGSLYETVRHCP